MIPAIWPRADRAAARLLHIDPERGQLADRQARDLPGILRAGDLLVVNDAATLPASFEGTAKPPGVPVEVRLAGQGARAELWTAVLFGQGSWRERTEDRPAPPVVPPGAAIEFAGGLRAVITEVAEVSPRLVGLRFDRDGADLWAALYRAGRPVQYSYLLGPLRLWHVQTPFASRPWAVEMPSAGSSLTIATLQSMHRRGIHVASVTHAAGLSSAGDPALDGLLPLPERYDIPASTVDAIAGTRVRGGRVVAAGTTVVRAIEGCCANHRGELLPGQGVTDLRIRPGFTPRIVQGILTGVHDHGTSHLELLGAFVPKALLAEAQRHAEKSGYLGHEFGDAMLALAA